MSTANHQLVLEAVLGNREDPHNEMRIKVLDAVCIGLDDSALHEEIKMCAEMYGFSIYFDETNKAYIHQTKDEKLHTSRFDKVLGQHFTDIDVITASMVIEHITHKNGEARSGEMYKELNPVVLSEALRVMRERTDDYKSDMLYRRCEFWLMKHHPKYKIDFDNIKEGDVVMSVSWHLSKLL